MSLLRTIYRRLIPPATVAAWWLAAHGTALAAEAQKKEEGGSKGSWVASYGVVLLGIVLGMLGVCLGSRRREREKPETYTKSNLIKE